MTFGAFVCKMLDQYEQRRQKEGKKKRNTKGRRRTRRGEMSEPRHKAAGASEKMRSVARAAPLSSAPEPTESLAASARLPGRESFSDSVLI